MNDWKERKKLRSQRFRDRFAIDNKWKAFKLTSYGCFQRHNTPRDEQNMDRQESRKRNFENISRCEWEERALMNDLSRFTSMGYKIGADEMVEEFVARIKHELGEDIDES